MMGSVPPPAERFIWKSKRVLATGAVNVNEYNPVADPPAIVIVPNDAPPLFKTDTVNARVTLPGITHITTVRVVALLYVAFFHTV